MMRKKPYRLADRDVLTPEPPFSVERVREMLVAAMRRSDGVQLDDRWSTG
jgi:hypothetical protein